MASGRVLLIGWDAADWKVIRPLMEAGKMPNVRRLVEQGASGQIRTLHPPLSPMLWTSIATGKRPYKHGIHGFSEPTPDGDGVRPITNLSRKAKAIWNILNQNGLRSVVVGWWPSHPAEAINGVMVSDAYHRAVGPPYEEWPLPPNTVYPPELAETLARLRTHPGLLVPAIVERFIPRAEIIDQEKDTRLAMFLRTLAECMTIASAANWLIEHKPWDFFAVYWDALDHFCHGFMKYHPPRQAWIPEADFELYKHVVSVAYQFHDEMLGTLLRKAGEDATAILISDHGFHADHRRARSIPSIPAGPAIEHRDFGILAMSGAGIKTNEVLHGSSVLDITPTILALFGIPVGQDMDGKVMSQALAEPSAGAAIPSWEDIPGESGCHPPHARLDPIAAQEMLKQMVALGYIEPLDENRQVTVGKTVRELQYNLGEAYQDDERHAEAYEIFKALHAQDPDETRFAVRLFVSCQALGLMEEMRSIVTDLDGRGCVADYLKAQVLTAEKRFAEALDVMERLADPDSVGTSLLLQIADLKFRLGRWREARETYENALVADPDNVHAYLGLSQVALRKRNYDVAARAALDALQRSDHSPIAHYLLGRALTGLGQHVSAAEAFRCAIAINPNFPQAHLNLAALLERHLGDSKAAREHRRLARVMRVPTPLRLLQRRERVESTSPAGTSSVPQFSEMPPRSECLTVVTGLPRSGTSMVMQMLAAASINVMADGSRNADEDNPRGYFEFEPVKSLRTNPAWLAEGRGRVVKIIAPLLATLPHNLPCRAIICERVLDEVLDSQQRMLARRGPQLAEGRERREILRAEYARTLERAIALLGQRPKTQMLIVEYSQAILDPLATAARIDAFLGGGLNVLKMAAAIDPALYRDRREA